MGYMIDGSISARYLAALRLLSEELGCSDGKAAEPYLTDVDLIGFEDLGFDCYGQRLVKK